MASIYFKQSLKRVSIAGGVTLALIAAGCGTAPKADLEANTPAGAVEEVSEMQRHLKQQQADLLAHESYERGMDKLEDARTGLQKEKRVASVLDDAAEAKAYFQRAEELTAARKDFSQPILNSRQAAIAAGARNTRDLNEDLQDIDKSLRRKSDNFTSGLKLEDFSEIQKKYLELEVKAAQNNHLERARNIIEAAEADNAKRRAPMSLDQAKMDEEYAENMILQNVRNPEAYTASVEKANQSADLLAAVMQRIEEYGPETTETAALTMIEKDREISSLSGHVEELSSDLESTKADAEKLQGAVEGQSAILSDQSSQLAQASQQVKFQQALEEARARFSEDEAEAYQQGDKLVIRLKKMNFPFGSDAIPPAALNLLQEVREVIRDLEPEKVTVEGHTDSTGDEKINQDLSDKRAEAVAGYIQSLEKNLEVDTKGYGENRPLASNETREGRATNRRVDIVISTKK